MSIRVQKVTLTTSYAAAFTIQPGTIEALLEVPETSPDATINAFVYSIGGVETTLTVGGAADAGGAWGLKLGTEPTTVPIVVYAKASTGLDAILTVWSR